MARPWAVLKIQLKGSEVHSPHISLFLAAMGRADPAKDAGGFEEANDDLHHNQPNHNPAPADIMVRSSRKPSQKRSKTTD